MKKLILLFDGTWNSAATGRFSDITNVFRLNLAISRNDNDGIPQITFYIPGPGNRGWLDREMGGIFGQGIDQIIREAYVNLSSNYEDGDRIYIYGYSRGSVAARALACLISESGLLKPQQLHRLASVWRKFIDLNADVTSNSSYSNIENHIHHGVKIDFMGLFDSVLGRGHQSPNRFSELVFKNSNVSDNIIKGVHFLAIDDDRKVFHPLLWGERNQNQSIEQIWVPGVHGDIGGYGRPEFIGISCLLTMISKSKSSGIAFNENFVKSMLDRLEGAVRVKIQSERSDIFSSLLSKKYRIPGDSKHLELKHPLFDVFYKKNLLIKNNHKRPYNFKYLKKFYNLKEDADNEYRQILIQYADETLARM